MIEVLKALADENRYRIIEMLLEKKYCVRALSNRLDISEPAVSQHLKILKSAGLVNGNKDGYFMHYRVNESRIDEVIDFLSELTSIESCSSKINRKCQHGERKCR